MTIIYSLPSQDSIQNTNISNIQTFDSTTLPATYLALNGSNQMTANLNANNNKIVNLANAVNNLDGVNLQTCMAHIDYEPPIIMHQSPYFHFCADAYGTTESSIFDLSSNNRAITFVGGTGGTTTFNSGLNGHKYVALTNRGFNFPISNNIHTCLAVVQYTNINETNGAFIFGYPNNLTGSAPVDFHDGGIGGTTPLLLAIMGGNYATTNSYNNFYLNGVLTNASTTLKPSGWFLFAFTSTTAVNI